jgi:hypothetical protein
MSVRSRRVATVPPRPAPRPLCLLRLLCPLRLPRPRAAWEVPAAARLARRLLADDEDSVLGQVDFVDGDSTARQQVAHGFRQGHLGEGDGGGLIRLGQAEQSGGLVVVEDEATGVIGEDEPLTQRMQGRIVEREEPPELLGAVAERHFAQIAAEQPRAESAESDRGERDDDDLRQRRRLRHGQGLKGHADGDHCGDLAVGVLDGHDRSHRSAERAHVLLGLAVTGPGPVGGSEVVPAQLSRVRVGVAGAVAIHDRDEVDLGGVDHGQCVGLQLCRRIVAGHRRRHERVVREGPGDAEHPFGGGLADIAHGRHIAGHRQGGADEDDEDELDEEEPPGQRAATGAESIPIPPDRHFFLPPEIRRASPIAASQVSLATGMPSSEGRIPSSSVIESMEK